MLQSVYGQRTINNAVAISNCKKILKKMRKVSQNNRNIKVANFGIPKRNQEKRNH